MDYETYYDEEPGDVTDYPDLYTLQPCGVCGDPNCADWDPGE